MKKLLLLFMFIPFFTFGQCEKEVDEFTGSVTIRSDIETLGNTKATMSICKFFIKSKVVKFDTTFYLVLEPEQRSVWSINEGDLIYIKGTNGDVIKLKNTKYCISNGKQGAAFVQGSAYRIHYLFVWLELDKITMTWLETNEIDKIRAGIYDYPINNKTLISEQIKCVNSVK